MYTSATVSRSDWVRGYWIWWERHEPKLDAGDYPAAIPDSLGFLRKTFMLSSAPERAALRICVNSRYILYVNGARVGSGPVRSEPLRMFYDEFDLTSLLREGPNVIAAWCRYYGSPNVFWKPSLPSGEVGLGWLICDIEGSLRDGTEIALRSDASWKAMKAPYRHHPPGIWQRANPSIEDIGGDGWPKRWRESDFDDSSWANAVVLRWRGLGYPASTPPADPHPRLSPRPIATLHEHEVRPAGVAAAGDRFVTWDFGRIVRAHPRVEVETTTDTIIDLACGEDIGDDGRPVILPREWVLRYTAGKGVQQIESFEAVGFRYLMLSASEPVEVVDVASIESHYPRILGAYFECDDEVINQIWQTGVRTLDLCSTDAFIDCPGREQRAWLGDAWLTTLISLVANPDTSLARWNLELHAHGQRADGLLPAAAAGDISLRPSTIPDFSLHWIRGLARFWKYTADARLVDDLIPHVPPIIEFFENFRSSDDLLESVPGWIFIDWAQTERGPNTAALDALYILALEDFATLAAAAGVRRWQRRAKELARRSRKAFACYWDSDRRVFVDSIPGRRVSQQTNSLAILAGCALRSRWDGILDYVLDSKRLKVTKTPADSMDWSERLAFQWQEPEGFDSESDVVAAQPFFSHFVHEALALSDRHIQIDELIRRWEMQLHSGNGCFEEYWSARPGAGSRCHVWSATPTYDLVTYFLGVRPIEPGFSRTEIRPFFGRFHRLAGAIPTPHGYIEMDLNRRGDRPAGKITIPEGVTCDLSFSEFDHLRPSVLQGPVVFDVGATR